MTLIERMRAEADLRQAQANSRRQCGQTTRSRQGIEADRVTCLDSKGRDLYVDAMMQHHSRDWSGRDIDVPRKVSQP
jgi:hypothetical protein